jgi:Protein of unknown function (DUF1572)
MSSSEPEGRLAMPETDAELARLFLEFSRSKLLGQYWPRLKQTVASLSDEQVWWRPNESSNSIGNLMLHLNGNVTQWLVASFSREADQRNRPQEFSERGQIPAGELLGRLEATMARSAEVLAHLTVADLLAPYEIQGYHVRGLDAVYQVVEHFGLHYGQILYIAKSLTARDLGYYQELNKTGRA